MLMADFNEAFNGKINNSMQLNNSNSIDHFFTQRKITKHVDYVDTSDMKRKNKKVDVKLNFIAINIPYYENISGNNRIVVEIKVYGDCNLKYHGSIESKEGYFPSFLLKLGEDKKLFIFLKFSGEDEHIIDKEYISFVDIPSRYQVEPSISDLGSELAENQEN